MGKGQVPATGSGDRRPPRLIFLELYPKPITLKCTPELYAKFMGEEHQHDTQENEHDER